MLIVKEDGVGWAEQAAVRLADLRATRDWIRYHTPKNLALALVGEVGEVAELLQWRTDDELLPLRRDAELTERLSDELADTAIYLLHLAQCLEVDLGGAVVDLGGAVHRKITTTYSRFPASDREDS